MTLYGPAGPHTQPNFASATSQLQRLSPAELREFLNEDSKVEDLVKELDQLKQFEQEKQVVIASNKSIAEFNLGREPRLNQAKQHLTDTYEKVAELLALVQEKKDEFDRLSGQQSLDTTLNLLKASTAEAEDESEAITERFLQGSLEVDSFLEEYQSKRQVAHMRRVKSEKMVELMRSQQQRRVSDSAALPPPMYRRPAPPPPPSGPGSIPYPIRPMGMPQPYPSFGVGMPWPNN